MKKFISVLIFFLAIGCFPAFSAHAAETITVTTTGAPTATFYPYEFDRLVMDFTVARADGTADILHALTLQNAGTAFGWDISKVVIWADAGPVGFQGMDVDEELGEATRYETGGYWYLSNLSKAVPSSGLRIFVSIETGTRGAITANHTIQMEVSPLSDSGTIGQFDVGDTGLFFAGATGVAGGIVNPSTQTIWVSNYDTSAPKTVITAPADGATITTSSYKITGAARDEGGSTPASVQIEISSASSAGSWADVTATGDNFSTWEYDWTNITDGTYTIKTKGADWLGNVETPSAGVAVTVDQTAATAASASLSTVSAAPQTLAANGVAQATASVTVKNSFGNPLSGKTVTLSSSRPADSVQPAYATTDTNGLATFTIKSLSAGESTLTASVGTIILNQKPTLTFTAVIFSAGDLIKSAGSSATYYYSSNGLKYIFPTAGIYSSWYSDFSSVKTIFAAELSAVPTSGNVTVRPGKLVQFVSMDTPWRVMDPKVYAVSQGGVLHWIKTADVARTIFGANWEKQIIAVPEVFETNYTLGTDVVAVSDYNLTAAQAVATIDQDKNL